MRSILPLSIVTFLVLCISSAARAEIFEIDDIIGPAPIYAGSPLVIEFDLEQEFAEIQNVLLMLEATTTPLSFQSCGWMFHPEPCELEVSSPGFFVRLEDPTGYSTHALLDGFRSDNPRKRAGVFERSHLDFSFEHLYDGKGTLTIHWNSLAFFPEQIVQDFSFPTGEIFAAKLIVEGTPLPEPSTSIQLLMGVLALAVRHGGTRCRRPAA